MKDTMKAVVIVAISAATAGYCLAESRNLRKESARSSKKAQAFRDFVVRMEKAKDDNTLTHEFIDDELYKLIIM